MGEAGFGKARALEKDHSASAQGLQIEAPAPVDRTIWSLKALQLLTEATADLLQADRPESSFEQLFRRIMEYLDCEFYFNYDAIDGELQLVCSTGLSPQDTESIRTLAVGSLLCGATAEESDLLYLPIDRIESHPNAVALHRLNGTVFVGLPLRVNGHLLGTLSFASTVRTNFSQEELDFLRTLRNTVAAAKARHRDMASIRQSEARFRAVTETCLDGLLVVDASATIREVNEAYLRASGFRRDDLVGRRLWELEHVPDAQRTSETLAESARGNRVRIQSTHLTKLRTPWPVEITVSRLPDQHVSHFIVIRDLTERVNSEKSLRESQERIASAIEHTHIVLWEADPATANFRFVLGPAETLLGYTNAEWLEPGFWKQRIHPIDRDYAIEFCRTATAAGRDHRIEYRMVHRDGSVIWVEDVISLVHAGERVIALRGALINVTQRKQMEEQLNQALKMEAIGRLAGGVAHDFNNVLTVISGYAELLEMSIDANDSRHEWVSQLLAASERAARLTDQLLVFSRASAIGRGPVDVNDVVVRSISLLNRLIGDDIHLDLSLVPHSGWIEADRVMVEQIILNLVINSRDAMPTGGTINIQTRLTERPLSAWQKEHAPAQRANHWMNEGSGANSELVPCVELRIVDHGCGMTEEQQAKIFEPFYTTKDVGRGTGLGMAVVYGATKQNGGLIEVESAPGVGTRVSVLFRQVSPASPECSLYLESKSLGRETILLVEDEEQVRKLAKLALMQQGYRVLEAAGADEAISLAANFPHRIDLLLTDVVMAGMGGRQLADRLTQDRMELKVLYISGYTDDAVLRHGVAEGIDHFLRKPFTPQSLTRCIRDLLQAKANPQSSTVADDDQPSSEN